MNECQFVGDCVLFRKTLDGQPVVAHLMKAKHCRREHEECGLRRISIELGPEFVPVGLYPNQTGRAELIIQNVFDKKSSPIK